MNIAKFLVALCVFVGVIGCEAGKEPAAAPTTEETKTDEAKKDEASTEEAKTEETKSE